MDNEALQKQNADLLLALQQAARLLRAAGFAMTGTASSQIMAAINAAASCAVPPPGWQCTRVAGHEGPCAAIPAQPMPDAIRRLAERLKWMLDADQFRNVEPMLRAIGNDIASAANAVAVDCTEPSRATCPRLCGDFCNAEEVRKAAAADAGGLSSIHDDPRFQELLDAYLDDQSPTTYVPLLEHIDKHRAPATSAGGQA